MLLFIERDGKANEFWIIFPNNGGFSPSPNRPLKIDLQYRYNAIIPSDTKLLFYLELPLFLFEFMM